MTLKPYTRRKSPEIGEVYGRWEVVAIFKGVWGQKRVRCQCLCGNFGDVNWRALYTGSSKSCGCLKRELDLIHGESRSLTYLSWNSMRCRCNNPRFKNYHGKGVTYWEVWNDYAQFVRDLGHRPSADHTLDRINNEGGYYPGNVRWATRVEQARNKSTNKLVTFEGETQCVSAWAERFGVGPHSLKKCIWVHGPEFALRRAKLGLFGTYSRRIPSDK